MSHYRLKTKYNVEGSWGTTEEKILYAWHNLSCDYVTFYDEDGEFIMTVPDTMDNNLLDAINKLYMPFANRGNNIIAKGVEYMDGEDCKKCGIK
jgi:hypothetical protein